MKQEIIKVKVKYGTSKKLAEIFEITTRAVGNAVNGKSNSDLAKKVRKAAVNLGGDPIYSNN